MKTSNLHLALLMAIIVIVSSCRKDEPIVPLNNGQPNEVAVGTLDLGANINADFQGRVVDENNNPLSNVMITVGSEIVFTDNNGLFVMKDVSVKEKLAYIKAQKSGYFAGSRSVIPSVTSSSSVLIEMMTLNVAGTIAAGAITTVTTNAGASIEFNGQYVDGAGNPYLGTVTVAAKYLPALDPSTSQQMPGMLYAENAAGDAGALESYGMVVVELFGSAGQSLNIAEGSFATVHMPVDDDQLGTAPATIPLWFFDEVAGYWVEDGSATLINGEYVGNVDHFTFWNCDYFYESCVHNGLVTDNLGNPVGNAMVTVDIGTMTSIGYTNADGTFWTYLPAGQTVNLEISYGCGSPVNTYTIGPFADGSVSDGTYISGMGTSILNITGTLVDCNADPITDGYVTLFNGTDYLTCQVTNGILDLDVPYCSIGSTVDLYIYDNSAPYAYFSSTAIPVTLPVTDLGQVTICDTISGSGTDTTGCADEFIDLQLSGSFVMYEFCMEFSYYDSVSQGFYLYTPVDPGYAIFSPDVNAAGTYPGNNVAGAPGEIIFLDSYGMDGTTFVNFSTDVLDYQGPGGQIVLSLSGTYIDIIGDIRTVTLVCAANIPL